MKVDHEKQKSDGRILALRKKVAESISEYNLPNREVIKEIAAILLAFSFKKSEGEVMFTVFRKEVFDFIEEHDLKISEIINGLSLALASVFERSEETK